MCKKIVVKTKDYLKRINNNGFSLLELVVAVGILLTITVGGLLAYRGVDRNARIAVYNNQMSDIYTLITTNQTFEDGNSDAESVKQIRKLLNENIGQQYFDKGKYPLAVNSKKICTSSGKPNANVVSLKIYKDISLKVTEIAYIVIIDPNNHISIEIQDENLKDSDGKALKFSKTQANFDTTCS